MANNFFVYKNIKVGKSLIEEDIKGVIETIYKKAKESGAKGLEFLSPLAMVGRIAKGKKKTVTAAPAGDRNRLTDFFTVPGVCAFD